MALLLFDVVARLREFERFGLDAASVSQQAEISQGDQSLYEWWFAATAKAANRSSGLGFTEDFLYKAAAQSQQLSFLRDMSLSDVLAFRQASDATALRDDLRLARLRIQDESASLPSIISAAGEHINEELSRFAASRQALTRARRRGLRAAAAGFGVTCVMTLASVVAPILSVVSLLWSRSAADVAAASQSEPLEELKRRPVATLVEWRSRDTTS